MKILVILLKLCSRQLYFYARSLCGVLAPVSASSLAADTFKIIEARVSKSKALNLLLISQLPK